MAFCIWGLSPIFFKQLGHVDAVEVLAHRVVWTVILLGLLFHIRGLWPKVKAECASARRLLAYAATTILIALNWGVFIWAINDEQIVEVSLGYYINPLVLVALAMVFLGERLRPLQGVAVILAILGVGYSVWQYGSVPLVTIILATSFSTYAVIRKREGLDPFIGLFIETLLMMPLAIAYIGYREWLGFGAISHEGLYTHTLLILAGIVTAVPLICYMQGAKTLPLKTMGLLSYLAPSLQLAIGVMLYNEEFSTDTQITFAFIWVALAVYSFDAFTARKQPKPG
ncbi:MAG: EamA family transporter RarD [Pseudomonadota bacterium]